MNTLIDDFILMLIGIIAFVAYFILTLLDVPFWAYGYLILIPVYLAFRFSTSFYLHSDIRLPKLSSSSTSKKGS